MAVHERASQWRRHTLRNDRSRLEIRSCAAFLLFGFLFYCAHCLVPSRKGHQRRSRSSRFGLPHLVALFHFLESFNANMYVWYLPAHRESDGSSVAHDSKKHFMVQKLNGGLCLFSLAAITISPFASTFFQFFEYSWEVLCLGGFLANSSHLPHLALRMDSASTENVGGRSRCLDVNNFKLAASCLAFLLATLKA